MTYAERIDRYLLEPHKVALAGDKSFSYCQYHGRPMVLGRCTSQSNGCPRRIERSGRQIACRRIKGGMGEGHD